MEPQKSLHGLEGPGPHRARRRGSRRGGPAAEGDGRSVRCGLHVGSVPRPAHLHAILLKEIGQPDLQTFKDEALNERDYGDLSGLNKDDARARWGEDQVHLWRRSYDVQPPGGESLKDTVARVLPYYMREILPRVMRGERVLVAAHGNSLRALVMVLDGLTPETIPSMELATGIPLVYRLKADTTVEDKKVLTA